jgi:hypothetical protein
MMLNEKSVLVARVGFFGATEERNAARRETHKKLNGAGATGASVDARALARRFRSKRRPPPTAWVFDLEFVFKPE